MLEVDGTVDRVRIIGVVVLVMVICDLLVFTRCSAQETRSIQRLIGVPISSRLLPDDEVVLVEENTPPLRVEPSRERTREETIRYAVTVADIVALVDVEHVAGELTDDGSWIRTRVTGTSREILLSVERLVGPGEEVVVLYSSGGELTIDNVLVRAGTPLKVTPSAQYFMFLRRNPSTGMLFPSYTPLLVEDGRLVNPWQVEPASITSDPLHGLTLEEVASEVRSVKN